MGKALTQVKDFLNYLGANADDHGRTHVSLIRATWNSRDKKRIFTWGTVLVVAIVATTLADFLLPHTRLWTTAKWLIAGIPAVYTGASLMYMASYAAGEYLTEKSGGTWVPIKDREFFSRKVRIWAVCLTNVFVVAVVTLMSSSNMFAGSFITYATIAFLFASLPFLHKTEEEREAEEFGVRDGRTRKYDERKEAYSANVAERKEEARKAAASKPSFRDRLLGIKPESEPETE